MPLQRSGVRISYALNRSEIIKATGNGRGVWVYREAGEQQQRAEQVELLLGQEQQERELLQSPA